MTYNKDCIATLLERLRPYELPKSEVIMILNIRPATASALNAIIDDMYDRFTEDDLQDIVNIVSEVLGRFEPAKKQDGAAAQESEAAGDVSMEDATAAGDDAS